ncbi:transcriptional regulator TetR family [Janthinobacterium sp. HH01]|nr:transcriptional regulator TetR family [Janthinobacterium sp. HH01]
MTNRRRPDIASRKQPQQARSTELVATILQAALQVLGDEGIQRFTTARVAERAGVSVGSVYQYFPNKASILFRLQADEWRTTTDMLRKIIEDPALPPAARLRALVRAFLHSECEEAGMRGALSDAAPLYRDAPEVDEVRGAADRAIELFMDELMPQVAAPARALAGDLITTTFSSVGSSFSQSARTKEEIDAYADAMTDMFCAYIDSLAHGARA